MHQDSHLETEGAVDDLGADMSAAEKAQGHGREVFADGHVVGVALFDPGVAEYQLPAEPEQ